MPPRTVLVVAGQGPEPGGAFLLVGRFPVVRETYVRPEERVRVTHTAERER